MGSIKVVKPEVRILGIDDGPFDKFRPGQEVLVVGVVFRGKDSLDGLLSTKVECDGNDATEKLIEMVKRSNQRHQIRFIMLDGIALGGFNVVDVEELYRELGIPVIVVIRRRPNMEAIERALRRFKDGERRMEILRKAGEVRKCGKIFFQCYGVEPAIAEQVIKKSTKRGNIPEPLRVAHIIASGIVLGESHGRA